MKHTKYTAKTLTGATRRVRTLERLLDEARRERDLWQARAATFKHERRQLARLAATTPQFDNALVIYEVEHLRDRILAENVK